MRERVSPGWKFAAIGLAVLLVSIGGSYYRMATAVKKTFHYLHNVTVVDDQTGEPLKFSVGGPVQSTADYFHQSHGVAAISLKEVEIFGVGYKERVIRFSSEGYEPQSLAIGPDSDHLGSIVIRLKKSS